MKKLFILAALIPLCNGCVSMAKLESALAKDPATVSTKISTIYGTASLVRVGSVSSGTTCTVSPDGTVTIRSN